jgi:hypothetical protein
MAISPLDIVSGVARRQQTEQRIDVDWLDEMMIEASCLGF